MAVKTYTELVAWIKVNVPPDKLKESGTANPRDAALWWAAYHAAELFVESSSLKDIARTFLHGLVPMDEDGVTEVLEGFYPNEDDDEGGDPIEEIEANLREWFEIE